MKITDLVTNLQEAFDGGDCVFGCFAIFGEIYCRDLTPEIFLALVYVYTSNILVSIIGNLVGYFYCFEKGKKDKNRQTVIYGDPVIW